MKSTLTTILIFFTYLSLQAQKVNDSTSPLHLLKPDYDTPYGKPEVKSITEVLDRIYNYLDQTTYMSLINKDTQAEVKDYSKIDDKTIFLEHVLGGGVNLPETPDGVRVAGTA